MKTMAYDIPALKARQQELLDQIKNMDAEARAADRILTEDEQASLNAAMDELEEVEQEITAQNKAADEAARRQLIERAEERVSTVNKPRTLDRNGPYARMISTYDRIMDDPKRGFKSFGDFAMDVMQAYIPGHGGPSESLMKISAAATGLNVAQGSQGGYLVPPSFSQMIWDGMSQMPENLMQYTDTHPIPLGTGSIVFNASAETSRVTGSRFGGLRAYWLAEAQQKTASSPRFRQLELKPHKLAVLIYVTDELLANAPTLESFLRRAASEEIMWMVNDAIINGSGAGQPLGIMNSDALITVAKENNQTADTVTLTNVNDMYARLLTRARAGAAWYINQDVEAQLEGLNVAVGTGGFPVYLPTPSGFPTITEAPNNRLKGRPVRTVEYMQTVGDKGDVLLADLGYYALGVQGGVQEAMSIHLRFDYDETCFRFVFMVDGQPWVNSPITPARGANTLSPFVTLAARA